VRGGFLDDEFACVLKWEHQGILENGRRIIVARD
jgi:hypothetical protein